MFRKCLSFLLSIALIFCLFASINTYSAVGEECIVKVETVKAITGDEVIVHLYVENNPGIMAMTISITYNPDALSYVRYYYGDVFTDYTVAAHPSRRLIRLVISENTDIAEDGTIAYFKFKVADDAENILHKMTVEYSSGDFCNNDLQRLMPKIVSGGVEVDYNGNNCKHKTFSEWTQKVAPSCDIEGIEERVCTKCPHTEHKNIDPIGHDFSDSFTVDIPATSDTPGTMSRHCTRCTATTNETIFTLEDTNKGDIDNKTDAEVPDNDYVDEIIQEQNPDISNPQNNSSNSNSSQQNTSSDKENIGSENTPDNNKNDNSQISSSESVNSSHNSSNTDQKEEKEEEEKKKNEEQIKDIIEILSPDDENPDETALTIAQKLREAIPQIDKVITGLRFSFIILFMLILL